MEKINILGTEWTVEYKDREADEHLDDGDGYCDSSIKTIVIENMKPEKDSKEDLKAYTKQVLRHEIIHAFLHESGLDNCSMVYNSSWAKCEEMVDWMAIQFPKIQKTFEEAGCI